MNILINYADSKYESARKWNTCTGRWIGKFDRIYEFKPEDIDENFRNQHKEILSIKRGNGAWLWKSYFLKKVLDDSNDGDYIMYLDSGAFFIRDPRILFEYIDDNNPIFVTDIPLIESNWTKPECFDIMDAWRFANTNQIQSGYIIFKVNKISRDFFDEYYILSSTTQMLVPEGLDKRDLVQSYYGSSFVSHREDQSILSLLCKKKGIKAHRDISQRGFKPETFYSDKYLYRVPNHKEDTYPTIVYLHKGQSLTRFVLGKIYSKLRLGKLKRLLK